MMESRLRGQKEAVRMIQKTLTFEPVEEVIDHLPNAGCGKGSYLLTLFVRFHHYQFNNDLENRRIALPNEYSSGRHIR